MSALSHACMWELDQKEGWVPKKWCFRTVVLEKILESPFKPVNPKGNQSWICWSFNTLATWCEEPTRWKRPWCWERLKAGEGDDRGWDGWMASLIQWTWIWTNSGRLWRTGKSGVLQSSGRKESDTTERLNSNNIVSHTCFHIFCSKCWFWHIPFCSQVILGILSDNARLPSQVFLLIYTLWWTELQLNN